jgi:phospholipase/lecithinase/hemolysin
MKKQAQIVIVMLLLGMFAVPVQAFTSLYIFGDGISTTTNNASAATQPQYWYGTRQSNGRVWVEVLAQRLGLGANSITNVNWSNSANNWSYYGQYSQNLMTNINYFVPPPDVNTAVVVVWVNCADFVADMGNIYLAGNYTNNYLWTNAVNQSVANHLSIIQSLYARGVRTLVMPNSVDIIEIPAYDNLALNAPADRNYIRQQVINFNAQFTAMLNQAQASLPGLTIYEPNFFGLLDNVLTNASAYGLTNALSSRGVSIDAYDDPNITYLALNGQGDNYIFWCPTAPTAMLSEIMADNAMQIIAPAQINKITISGNVSGTTTNQLVMANLPVGLNGFVDGSTNLGASWAPVANVSAASSAQAVSFTAPPLPPTYVSGSPYLPFGGGGSGNQGQNNNSSTGTSTNSVSGLVGTYRLRFPLAWNWP